MPEYYTDPTPIDIENWVDMDKVDELHRKLANWIRVKMNGIDVREALARLVEQTSSDLFDANQVALALEKLAYDLEEEWKKTLGGLTVDSELINSRIDLYGFVYSTLKERLDAMQKNEIFLFKSDEVNQMRTILDNDFSNNHEVMLIKRIEIKSKGMPGLVIAEIDNQEQNRFKLIEVGIINVNRN